MIRTSLCAALLCMTAPAQAALTVSEAPTSNVACDGGTCTATAADAVLNVKDLTKFLKAGDLTLAAGADAMDVVVDAPFAWAKHALTLDAFRAVAVRREMTVQGRDHVSLVTNDGGSGGELTFPGEGRLTFWDTASALTIDGQAYALVRDVQGLRDASLTGFTALAADYDAAPDGVYRHNPVRFDFSGTFEGLGHTIANLTMTHGTELNQAVYGGLFGVLKPTAAVRDLNLANVSMTAHFRALVGALAGYNQGSVAHVSASVTVTGGKQAGVGGLFGRVGGTVSDCTVTGTVNAGQHGAAGGVTWSTDPSGTILRTHADVDVTGGTAGGLVAYSNGTIRLSSASGAVSAAGVDRFSWPFAAGLVAESYGTIDRSFSTGPVDAGSGFHHDHRAAHAEAGGLVGSNRGVVVDSYTTSAVSVGTLAHDGGFQEINDGTVANSYAAGPVTRADGPGGGFSYYGGDGLTNAYWDTDTAGVPEGCVNGNCKGITGLTTAELQSGLPAGFDPSVWAEAPGINNGFPYLIDNPPQ